MAIERDIVPRLEQKEKRTFFHPDGNIAQSTQMELGFRGGYTVRGEFTEIGWRQYHPARSFTSDPDLMKRIFEVGPTAFAELPKDAVSESVITFEFMNNRHSDKPSEKFAHIIEYDATDDLITLFEKEPVELLSPFYRECKPGIFDDGASNTFLITQVFEQFDDEIFESPLYMQLPAVQKSVRELGLRRDKSSITFASPPEYVRRMDTLRDADKDSGLYYPRILLYPGGEIPREVYLPAHVEKVFPVAAHDFLYHTHDALTAHFLAHHVYGEPLVNMLSWYAKGLQTFDSEHQSRGIRSMDTFTDALGKRSLFDQDRLFYGDYLWDIGRVVSKVGSLEDLEIVQWMRGKNMLTDRQRISDDDLIDGLSAHARGRLKV
ncbi:MAG: hypothetical protein H0W89_06140 [Candidatus Levybacteria bacterium]|nr:hypothetical protein [Candidatus Levybacteria bacterium]